MRTTLTKTRDCRGFKVFGVTSVKASGGKCRVQGLESECSEGAFGNFMEVTSILSMILMPEPRTAT
jgi:hypothetical protein